MPHGGSEACEDECYRYYFLEVVAVHAARFAAAGVVWVQCVCLLSVQVVLSGYKFPCAGALL